MPLADVIRATTATPAMAVRREDHIGGLAAGHAADISVFELRDGHWALPDAAGATEVVERLLIPRMVIRAGEFTELGAAAIAGDPVNDAVARRGTGG